VKIVSGGQTGVDRAALDVALKHGIDCGGWCPAGRLDEFGRIPDRYPLTELKQENKEKRGIFEERTMANARDSEGTIVIYCDQLLGGTKYTVECCKQLPRPYQLIDASKIPPEETAELIAEFVRKQRIDILNVAGPRQSEWPKGYDYAFRALDGFLTSYSHRPVGG
jgi:hypothetical protein